MKKKIQSALFSPPGRWTGNNLLLKGGPMVTVIYCMLSPLCEKLDLIQEKRNANMLSLITRVPILIKK